MLTHLEVLCNHPPGGSPLASITIYTGDEGSFDKDFRHHADKLMHNPSLAVLMGQTKVELLYRDEERSEYHCWFRGDKLETLIQTIDAYRTNSWVNVPMKTWMVRMDDIVMHEGRP